jgi:Cof subfamily protein (haloacid dehalogenase superfamily)
VIRLVASDVDGTLLDHHGRLPAGRAAAVRRLGASGVPLVLATGKLWTSVRALIDELELAGPHVACNGSIVFDGEGRILDRTLLDTDVADEVTDVLRARGVVHAVYLADGTIVTDRTDPAHDVLPLLGEPRPTVGAREGRGVVKVLAILPADAEGDLRGLAADVARVQRTGPRFLEWNARTADKATGLATVAGLLDVALADVLAVGDAENDVPMLRAAGIGVAVADASPAARAAADRVLTEDLTVLLGELAADRRAAIPVVGT